VNGHPFDPEMQINRPGLALAGGLVIIMWGSFLDVGDRGWVTAFDGQTLGLRGAFCTTCFAGQAIGGMIWQSGRPPAVEADRYVYFLTGNGWLRKDKKKYETACTPSENPAKPAGYYAESLVRLDLRDVEGWKDNRGIASWTPHDWCELDRNDADLGGSGPMLITGAPIPSVAIAGGKAGVLYAIDVSRIDAPDLVEWRSIVKSPGGPIVYGAINECVDFESLPGSSSYPPFNPILPGNLIDVPANHPAPWAVSVGPTVGGEHSDHAPGTFRPLCAPLNATLMWGKKNDGTQHHIMAGAVFLPTPNEGATGRLYVAPENLPVLAFDVQSGRLKHGPFVSRFDLKEFPFATLTTSAHPGAMLAISANGSHVESGIVWASHYREGKGGGATTEIRDGVLEAFSAADLRLLWSSDAASADHSGYFQKFTPPTIANGKVYLATSPSPGWKPGTMAWQPQTPWHPVLGREPKLQKPCLQYDCATLPGAIVVYGKTPWRWPLSRRTSTDVGIRR
jgi:hypothetical protein